MRFSKVSYHGDCLESSQVYTIILVCDGGYTRIIKKMENDFVCDVIVGDSDFLSVSDVKNTFDAQFVLAGWHF